MSYAAQWLMTHVRAVQIVAPLVIALGTGCAAPPPAISVNKTPSTSFTSSDATADGGPSTQTTFDAGTTYDLAQPPSVDAGTTSAGCGAVTDAGSCVGQVATYCDNGTVQREDCSSEGLTCKVDSTGAYCDDATTSTPDMGGGGGACGSVTENGVCAGNTLKYCDGQLETVDCSQYGGCVVDSSGYADCADF